MPNYIVDVGAPKQFVGVTYDTPIPLREQIQMCHEAWGVDSSDYESSDEGGSKQNGSAASLLAYARIQALRAAHASAPPPRPNNPRSHTVAPLSRAEIPMIDRNGKQNSTAAEPAGVDRDPLRRAPPRA